MGVLFLGTKNIKRKIFNGRRREKTILILDPYLEGLSGHFFNNIYEICWEFKELGFKVVVAGASNFGISGLSQDISFIPAFSPTIKLKRQVENIFLKRVFGFFTFAICVLKNCLIIRRLISQNHPHIIFQTTTYLKDLVPWVFLKKTKIPKFLLVHVILDHLSEKLGLKIFSKFGDLEGCVICSYSRKILDFFMARGVRKERVLLLPPIIPIFPWRRFLGSSPPKKGQKNLVFCYAGIADKRKGFLFLSELIPDSVKENIFKIQCFQNVEDPEITKAIQKLIELESPNLHLFPQIFSEEEFFNFIYESDCLLLPYSPDHYGEKGGSISGILTQAFLLGKPVIVSADTWLAEKVLETGAGIIFKFGDKEDFKRALEKMVCEYPIFSKKATEVGKKLKEEYEKNNIAKRISTFLEENF